MTGPRLFDVHEKGNTRSTRLLYSAAVEGDCIVCNRPRDLDPTRGGCRCVSYQLGASQQQALAVLVEFDRQLARAQRRMFWRRLWWRYQLLWLFLIFLAAFGLLAVL